MTVAERTSSKEGGALVDAVVPSLTWARELAEALVEAGTAAGASACDATVGLGSSLSASARNGEVEDVTRSSSRAAGLRVIVDGRLGFAASSDAPMNAAAIATLARMAVELARASTPSPHHVLPSAPPVAREILEAADHALALWDDDTAALEAAWAIERAIALERIAAGHDGVAGVRDASASARRGIFALASSTGFSGAWRGTAVGLSCSAVAVDGERKQIDGWSHSARAVRTLPSVETIANEAARRALARRGARKVASERLPVIFDPPTARGFVGAIVHAACGDAVARRQSFLADKLGDVVWIPGHPLVDDPAIPGGFGSRPFDGEGLPTDRTVLVDADGALATWLLDAQSAARLGLRSTGHAARGATSLPSPGPTNTILEGGQGDLAAIVADTPRGLLVTRLLGRGPDPTTGAYSRGAAGFFIDGGAIAFPVENVVIAGHMDEMMRGIDRVGADHDLRAAIRAPTLRFATLQVSGR